MNARTKIALPELPLDGIPPPPPVRAVEGETLPSSSAAVGQTSTPGQQYRRLFGDIPPAEAIGIPLPAFRDPTLPAECHLSDALADVGRLRTAHFLKGFTLDHDIQRGPAWFWHGIHHFWWRAMDAAHDPKKRRKHKIAAAALLIASIEADDFLAQQQENAR